MLRAAKGIAISLALSVCGVSSALANQSYYDFTLNWESGPLQGTTSTGHLSFDSSLAAANAEYFDSNLLTSFQATIGSNAYALTDIATGAIYFSMGMASLRAS